MSGGGTDAAIDAAAALLRAGELVVFPTETVYGLGADATNGAAIAKIFALKNRPANNPLIVHVASLDVARNFAAKWTESAERLARHFWPGPLTLVVAKARAIAGEVTANGQTVGLRAPNHPVALRLLEAFGGAIAAPSANRSNYISPTTAGHVREEFGDVAPLILDGGACSVGIESTVVDVTGAAPQILRPGAITLEMIHAILGSGGERAEVENASDEAVRSPGQLLTHYAPRTPAYRFEPTERFLLDLTDAAVIDLTLDAETYARNLYARLRLLDGQTLRAIYVELPPDVATWRAARDRVMRATKPFNVQKRPTLRQ